MDTGDRLHGIRHFVAEDPRRRHRRTVYGHYAKVTGTGKHRLYAIGKIMLRLFATTAQRPAFRTFRIIMSGVTADITNGSDRHRQ
jgi:hypothetical protein